MGSHRIALEGPASASVSTVMTDTDSLLGPLNGFLSCLSDVKFSFGLSYYRNPTYDVPTISFYNEKCKVMVYSFTLLKNKM